MPLEGSRAATDAIGRGSLRTQVLVVGAGPVGLVAALDLRRRGIDVCVVDQQWQERAHSYPAILHAQSLRLLRDLGLSPAAFRRSQTVTRLAVYTEHQRRTVLDFPKQGSTEGSVLTLPRDVLVSALLDALDEAGVTVAWGKQLLTLEQHERAVCGELVEAGQNERLVGPLVSRFEAAYVIGADGYDSTVRSALDIELVQHGPLQTFAFFDSAHYGGGNEAQLCLSSDFANSVYPLHGRLSRFSFQLGRGLDREPDPQALRDLVLARTPWYPADVAALEWGGVAEFRQALAARFGRGRCWLAGDAAHTTGPLGVQSLNVGLTEASELSERIADALTRSSPLDLEASYGAPCIQQWAGLLGLTEQAALGPRSPDWARRHAAKLVSCLPAAGADLDALLEQLGMT